MSARVRTVWSAVGLTLAIVTSTLAGLFALTAWAFGPSPCEDSAARSKQVASSRLLDLPPPDARPSPGWEHAEPECLDDSGEAWLAVTRRYDSEKGRQAVHDHYRSVAGHDGWTLEHPEDVAPGHHDPLADLCFAKVVGDGPVLVRIHFEAPGSFFVSAESGFDGTPMGC